MKLFITGICGFTGFTLARKLAEEGWVSEVRGIDNLSRPGSRIHRKPLEELGIEVIIGDIREPAALNHAEGCDWVIDAAAQPSVLAGVDGKSSSREVVEHNLYGTINILEFCKTKGAGFVLLSTSRVYSLEALGGIEVEPEGLAYQPVGEFPDGFSKKGIAEHFSTEAPLSLYGATKRASEQMALEYGATFDFPVWINRCGVLAGAHQFGHPTQGIFSYWLHSWRNRRPLKYIGFDGNGSQVRDCLHPGDLIPVLRAQFENTEETVPRTMNFSGGPANSCSLAELSRWCEERWGPGTVKSNPQTRKFDLPWIVLDTSLARKQWKFNPTKSLEGILTEIADFADAHPEWLDLSLGER